MAELAAVEKEVEKEQMPAVMDKTKAPLSADSVECDIIKEALLEAKDGTRVLQRYLDLKQAVDIEKSRADVLQEANETLRKQYGRLVIELKETRRALDGRIPTVIEIEKPPAVRAMEPEEETALIDKFTPDEVRAFFEL